MCNFYSLVQKPYTQFCYYCKISQWTKTVPIICPTDVGDRQDGTNINAWVAGKTVRSLTMRAIPLRLCDELASYQVLFTFTLTNPDYKPKTRSPWPTLASWVSLPVGSLWHGWMLQLLPVPVSVCPGVCGMVRHLFARCGNSVLKHTVCIKLWQELHTSHLWACQLILCRSRHPVIYVVFKSETLTYAIMLYVVYYITIILLYFITCSVRYRVVL